MERDFYIEAMLLFRKYGAVFRVETNKDGSSLLVLDLKGSPYSATWYLESGGEFNLDYNIILDRFIHTRGE